VVRGWEIFADSRTFYFKPSTGTTNLEGGEIAGFGDFTSKKSGDAYSCFIQCHSTSVPAQTTATNQGVAVSYITSNAIFGTYAPRAFTGLGGSIGVNRRSVTIGWNVDATSGSVGFTYPNGPNNGIILGRMAVMESAGAIHRGMFRGFAFIPQNSHGSFTNGDMLNGQDEWSGRRLTVSKVGGPAATTSGGMALFDITGPWE
jgi:hypothetical protein